MSSSRSIRRSSGKSTDHSPTTTTTAGAAPSQAAVAPDSNSPSSLEAPMNTLFAALTRPRMAGGVPRLDQRDPHHHAHHVPEVAPCTTPRRLDNDRDSSIDSQELAKWPSKGNR